MPSVFAWIDARMRLWHVAAAFLAAVAAVALARGVALPRIRALAADKAYFQDNPPDFDERFAGYGLDVARAHLKALGPDARDYYAATFYPMYDVFLPVALLAFGVALILWMTRRGARFAACVPAWARLALLAAPVAFFGFDLGENASVSAMLAFGDDPPLDLVERASGFTRLKYAAACVEAAVAIGLVVLAAAGWRKRRRRDASG